MFDPAYTLLIATGSNAHEGMFESLPRNEKKQRKELMRAISFLSQIAMTIVGSVVIGIFLGRFLDNLLGTTPWLLLVFSLLGVAAAIKAIFDMGMKK